MAGNPYVSCFHELMCWNSYGNGRGAAHHPTRAGHLHRGETVAYTILLPFLDALFEVAADLESGTADKKMLLQSMSPLLWPLMMCYSVLFPQSTRRNMNPCTL